MYTIIISGIFLCAALVLSSSNNTCSTSDSGAFICCYGYEWNDILLLCTECELGFTGVNCTVQCPYPSHGRRCQENCNCEKESCDFRKGCPSTNAPTPSSRQPPATSTTFASFDGQARVTTESYGNIRSPKKEAKVLFFTVVGLIGLFVILSLIFTVVKCRGEQVCLRNQQHDENATYSSINRLNV